MATPGSSNPAGSSGDRPTFKAEKVKMVVWADSHLTDRYGFPPLFDWELKAQNRFEPLVNNSYGGKIFNQTFLEQFKHSLEKTRFGKSTCHLIFLGGNNIRRAYRAGKNRTTAQREENAHFEIDQLINRYRELFLFAKNFPTVKLVILSPLPSLHIPHEPFHEKFSNLLRLLSEEHQALFVDIRPKFLIDGQFANRGLFRDDVHLNLTGIQILAQTIPKAIRSVPTSFFQLKTKKILRLEHFKAKQLEQQNQSEKWSEIRLKQPPVL